MAIKYRKVLSRRTLLRGGSVAIALPFLESMTPRSLYGAPPEVDIGAISLMYGLGTPYHVLDRGFEGPLRYYDDLISNGKLTIYSDVDMRAAADNPEDAQHHNGQPYLFSGYRTQLTTGNAVIPQGPTLHYELMNATYPEGPPSPFRIIDVGIYFRRGINYQYQRIFDREGRNAADFEDLASPVDFFQKLFGEVPGGAELSARERSTRSVIDYVLPAYEKYTTGSSALPAGDITVLSNHLERVRQIERNVYQAAAQAPPIEVSEPSPPDLDYYVDGGNDAEPENVHRVSPADFATAYQIMADLFVAGLQTDRFRFGNLSFDSGGGHTHFVGPYAHPDNADYAFDGNPHHDYHRLSNEDPLAIEVGTAHNYFIHENVSQVLAKLDSNEFLAPNGQTLLDNLLVMIGSEVGTNHDVSRVMHAFAGGAGRFTMGQNVTSRVKAIELYNAIGHAYGLDSVGDGRDYESDENSILA
jgi:hypothetical protein